MKKLTIKLKPKQKYIVTLKKTYKGNPRGKKLA